jgi:hypothetical protein
MVTQNILAFIASEYTEVWGIIRKYKHCQTERLNIVLCTKATRLGKDNKICTPAVAKVITVA